MIFRASVSSSPASLKTMSYYQTMHTALPFGALMQSAPNIFESFAPGIFSDISLRSSCDFVILMSKLINTRNYFFSSLLSEPNLKNISQPCHPEFFSFMLACILSHMAFTFSSCALSFLKSCFN